MAGSCDVLCRMYLGLGATGIEGMTFCWEVADLYMSDLLDQMRMNGPNSSSVYRGRHLWLLQLLCKHLADSN